MERLIEGIARFRKNIFPKEKKLFEALASSQSPEALFITCSDSRVDPNLITQSKPGDLFICRNAGNIVPPHTHHTGGMTASIEYAITLLGIKHIIICGHADCGAMRGAITPDLVKDMPHVCEWLGHADTALHTVQKNYGHLNREEQIQHMIEQNVVVQLQHIRTHPCVAVRLESGEVTLHGWVYDIATGMFKTYNSASNAFEPMLMEKELKSLHKH